MKRSLPLLAFLIPVFFLPDYCIGSAPGAPVTAAVLAVSVLCFAALRFTLLSPRAPAFEAAAARLSGRLILAAAAAYFAASLGYCMLRYARFAFPEADLGVFLQSFWTATKGRLFWNTHELYPGGSHFGKHFTPLWFLILPFYAARPHASTLFALTAASLALFGAGVYLYARERLGRYGGLCIGLAAVLHPGMAFQAIDAYFDMHYAPLLLIMALVFFQRERRWPFLLFLILACSVREDIALTTFAFGVLALVRRRSASWVVLPMLISACWFAAAVYVVIPLFGRGTVWSFFGDLGADPFSVLLRVAADPSVARERFLAWDYLGLVYSILLPLAVVPPLLGAESLGAVPALAIIALSSRPQTRYLGGYYYLPCIPFLFAGAASGVASLAALRPFRALRERGAVSALCVFLLFLSLAAFIRAPAAGLLAKGLPEPFPRPGGASRREAYRAVLERIPPGAGVFAPRYLTPYLAHRTVVTSVNPTGADYIVIDSRTGDRSTLHWQGNPRLRAIDGNRFYVKVFEREGVRLYRRTAPPAP